MKQDKIIADIKCSESDIRTLMNMKRVMTSTPLKIHIYSKKGANHLGVVDVRSIEEGTQGGVCEIDTPIIPMKGLTLTYHKDVYFGDGIVLYPPYFRVESYIEEDGTVRCEAEI